MSKSSQLFIQKGLKETLSLIKELDKDKVPSTGTLILYLDLDNETTDLRHEPLDQTRSETDDGGHSGDPFP